MTDFNLLQKRIKEKKVKKSLFVMFFVAIIFPFVTYLTFSAFNLKEQDIPNYDNLVKDNGNEYRDYANDTSEDTGRLLKDSQIDKMKQYKNLIGEISYKKRGNPFSKPF